MGVLLRIRRSRCPRAPHSVRYRGAHRVARQHSGPCQLLDASRAKRRLEVRGHRTAKGWLNLFTGCRALLASLNAARGAGSYECMLATLARIPLLIIDFGIKPLRPPAGPLLGLLFSEEWPIRQKDAHVASAAGTEG